MNGVSSVKGGLAKMFMMLFKTCFGGSFHCLCHRLLLWPQELRTSVIRASKRAVSRWQAFVFFGKKKKTFMRKSVSPVALVPAKSGSASSRLLAVSQLKIAPRYLFRECGSVTADLPDRRTGVIIGKRRREKQFNVCRHH